MHFPFTDLSGARLRPAIVVQNLPGDDMILCMVTSQSARDADAIPLDSSGFSRGSLHKPSNIRPNRLFTGENRIVNYQAGTLTQDTMDVVTDAVVDIVRR
ncbi:MAG: type II toxin-antitoxin system PemK/MazF family toxin [Chloroflexota bacterium]|nr:type II toxin-antitoxin system PemK/MazF family toxin [Chloroflexota bacterium]MDQ5865362.1 type II toxin-antitoxin system PemK/MazF family toxin [Chloroflexota bacterium]